MKYECIINEEPKICPHKVISGKICSLCKIPDYVREEKLNERSINNEDNKKMVGK